MPLFRKPPVVNSRIVSVVGMHRSGTSCLAGSLQQKGLYLGEVATANEYNKKGNRENTLIAQLNDSVLDYSGGSWYEPPEKLRWTRKHEQERDRIIAAFEAEHVPVWGFKEPRALLTMPFWRKGLPDMGFVGTYRHPQLVALSLERRDSMPRDYAMDLWTSYNQRLLELHAEQPFPVISFDLDHDTYVKQIEAISRELKLPEANSGEVFIEQGLKNTVDGIPTDDTREQALELYAELERISFSL